MHTFWAPTSALLAFGPFVKNFLVYESHWKLRPWNFACNLMLLLRIFWYYFRSKQRIFAYQKFRKTLHFLLIFIKIPVLCRKHCRNRTHTSFLGHKNVVRSVFNLSSVLSLELWLVAGGMLVQISVFSTIWCGSHYVGAMWCRPQEGYGAVPLLPHNWTTGSTEWPMPSGNRAEHPRRAIGMGRQFREG